ncbi:MAG: DEAD/DEAH box helicase [Candidatus Accumulibacter sp.]|uniref:DEAD/DEAH box helicase n=1 Tax=Accumulibacter sp. TaxID=2053492 RepID=UPI0025EE7DFF|nr:DEAD/DEAH box helicase [Accumulibacter sp.]MCP5249198.1 DEAD/DEAH box helicase [Accumulibacter sp.]
MTKTSGPSSARGRKTASRPTAEPRLSRQRKPAELPADDWQRALRRQFGREQTFDFANLGDDPVFSDFTVRNPESGRHYRIVIRGSQAGDNRCSCPDFATNDLGTCKHIEFILARITADAAGQAALASGFQGSFSELFLDYAGQRRIRLRLGRDFPSSLLAAAHALFDAGNDWQLSPDRFAGLGDFIDQVRGAGHELRCQDDALAFVAELRDGEARRKMLAALYPIGADSPELQALLKVAMYPYQREGALFAARAGRALIGDEMGLGKTVQAIAAMEIFARHFAAERVLVVCPTSLKHQWEREIARFSERRATVIGGLRAVRQARYAQDDFCKITNYETLGRDLDLIQAWAPDVVIVDEAQRIKNWNTIAARALKRIDSSYALVLTGTPLENRLEELISIVQFVDQHRLGPTWRLLEEHQQRDERGRVIGYCKLQQIGETLAPIMLRRRKAAVLEQLPERVDNTLFVPMTPQQAVHHDENAYVVARIVQRWRHTGFLSDKDQLRLRCAMQNMRMSCNSTFLLDHESDYGYKADELAALLDDILDDPQAKVVVFSQWLRTHELIIRRLNARGWEHVLFHGGVPGDKRGALVDRFNKDPACRVFLSTDAGGVGLNLQHAAAVVINMDLPWNPAVLEQRIGRVHRLGQTRGVQVINFVARGTIEEGMLSVLAFKQSLFAGVLDGGESEVVLQGTRLSKFMEAVEKVTGAVEGQAAAEDDRQDTPPLAATADADAGDADDLGNRELQVPEAAAAEASAAANQTDEPPPGTPGEPGAGGRQPATAAAATPPATADAWAPLLAVGAQLLGELAAAAQGERQSPWIQTDPASGQRYIRLPMPDPKTVQNLTEGLQRLLGSRP